MLACIDIGNTHVHFGLMPAGGQTAAIGLGELRTDHIEQLGERIRATADQNHVTLTGVALCSVVPAATLLAAEALFPLHVPVWQLTHESDLGVPITYPVPAEIGHDRLANAAGAAALGQTPAIIIDLGTAATFDIVTRRGGYEGGIIAPGPALMTRYLHEHTAQLPLVEDVVTPVPTAIGKSTVEAMRIGAVLGFTGLIQACLDGVEADLAAAGESPAHIFTCGGAAPVVSGRLRQPTIDVPDLTLRGLAAAWTLNRQ
ncbi:type III pantothenate kinase [Synoicihabitans lomoniglobus]|uniref:Type III pantothenate kinase n=1 Tax=Synoicihabitans lomoniglobus TaxID=2909285 RepID=A0AAE9ZV17_9BACT|nr:type III pantothenate kinase [Opitutaceae bacterium LMO-M01]WED63584.1 type III pantothenate kinase [Opitutaceae bacterium LMO-M01]